MYQFASTGERLIRTGRRLSDDLGAEWIVVFVETPGHTHMPVPNQDRVVQNLHLAEQLGARIVNLSGASVADTVLEFARQNNVTKIIAGKPLRPRWFELLRGGSVVDQIIPSERNDRYLCHQRDLRLNLCSHATAHQPVKLEMGRIFKKHPISRRCYWSKFYYLCKPGTHQPCDVLSGCSRYCGHVLGSGTIYSGFFLERSSL